MTVKHCIVCKAPSNVVTLIADTHLPRIRPVCVICLSMGLERIMPRMLEGCFTIDECRAIRFMTYTWQAGQTPSDWLYVR